MTLPPGIGISQEALDGLTPQEAAVVERVLMAQWRAFDTFEHDPKTKQLVAQVLRRDEGAAVALHRLLQYAFMSGGECGHQITAQETRDAFNQRKKG